MTNYTNNSHREKDKPSAPKVEQVTRAKVSKRSKPLGRKMAETFVGDDAQNVGTYVLFDVMLPAAKDMLYSMVSQGFERFLFGDSMASRSYRRPGQSRGYTSYDRISRERPRRETIRRERVSDDAEEFVFSTRTEAEVVLDRMMDLIDNYDICTVANLYELTGQSTNFTHEKWGWDDLRGARVQQIRDGYILNLPPTKAIDG